ncbi:transcriptional antiterminator/mannitol/fructose-specific phosphotransferase system IIA component (Ntr-type) [Bacillus pakistanensis]|uniref:Ascorbate-specific PTS system EIIA component n=1 Tax=Rossellomorea pakistanensis TaxID=992288 RepID=A0ABS2ND08_9BACI|nr:BglG family transcription antiterminator [Bacillus pakistanensis]MBM7585747.1 transcriptional antiterminator/mannitol/fructose-specific phosphotransferase system IIA component (Ntr-type) [Bacillus pakistanensis]
MLESRSIKTFTHLMASQPKQYELFLETYGLTERQFFYDLEKINEWLKNRSLPIIQTKGSTITIPIKAYRYWQSYQKEMVSKEIHLNEQDRILFLYLYTFIRLEPLSNAHFRSLLQISKNTVSADVKKANELGKSFRVGIKYTRENGYHLRGSEEDKRNLALKCISVLSLNPLAKEMLTSIFKQSGNKDDYLSYERVLMEVKKHYTLDFIEERMFEFISLLQMVHIRQQQNKWVQMYPDTKEFLENHEMFKVAETIQSTLSHSTRTEELTFLAIQLLGISQGQIELQSQDVITTVLKKALDDFEKYICVEIIDKSKALESLYSHFKPAYFRMLYKIPITNHLLADIKQEHPYLYTFVQKVMNPIQDMLNIKIPEDELGYLTIHFGALLEQNQTRSMKTKAIIVCPNGVSSSLMLETQLKSLFPQFQWKPSLSKLEFQQQPTESYDLIFSTVPIQSVKPLFIVKPFMNEVDKRLLHQHVSEKIFHYESPYLTPEQLMRMIEQYADVKEPDKLRKSLSHMVYGNVNTDYRRKQPVLNELLTEEMVNVHSGITDWKAAIALAAEPLIQNNHISPSYIDAMISNIETLGPYVIVGPEIAIPHSRPENGVHHVGMSLLKLDQPVHVLDSPEHPVKIFICLAATDNSTHLKALSQLTKLLSKPETLTRLKAAQSKDEIMNLINEYSAS